VLKRENRIKSRREFVEIKNEGKLLYSPFFGFLVHKENDKQKKFGFIVSKKISKRAVDRNKIRRILSEVIRKNLEKFEDGIRVIFLTKKEILGKKMKEIEKEVEKFVR
jgi:ribonuclease P protein component